MEIRPCELNAQAAITRIYATMRAMEDFSLDDPICGPFAGQFGRALPLSMI
jgi:hypothetical protein